VPSENRIGSNRAKRSRKVPSVTASTSSGAMKGNNSVMCAGMPAAAEGS
jgi:hypothetical protein